MSGREIDRRHDDRRDGKMRRDAAPRRAAARGVARAQPARRAPSASRRAPCARRARSAARIRDCAARRRVRAAVAGRWSGSTSRQRRMISCSQGGTAGFSRAAARDRATAAGAIRARSAGSPNGRSPGGEEIKHDAERKQIAARVGAVAHAPARARCRGRCRSAGGLSSREIGKLIVARQAEVDQRGLAALAHDDVARLESR